jgi:transcriptional regulator with XRE-family HTH domain
MLATTDHRAEQVEHPGQFGVLLRRWRRVRGMSQLALAHLAKTSPRHVSFLETGRARPGKDLVLELAYALRVSLRDINDLMSAAGLPRLYAEDRLNDSQDMAPFRTLINNLVHNNPMHPCCVVDRYWRVQDANRSLRVLWKKLGWDFEIPDYLDVIDRVLSKDPRHSKLLNQEEVARQFAVRLRSEMALEDTDEELEQLAEKLETRIRYYTDPVEPPSSALPLTLPCHYQVGDEVYSAVVGISRFGGTPHIELNELRLIWYISANKESAALLERLIQESELSED